MKKYAVALFLTKFEIKTENTGKLAERLKIYIAQGINIKDVEDKAALLVKDDYPGFKIKYGYATKI